MAEDSPEIVSGKDTQGKYTEVLFPRFTDLNPGTNQPANFFPNNTAIIPIYRLCHVTHEVEAAIIQENAFTFIPKKKFGKALHQYDGTPVGTTYKETEIDTNRYQEIPRSRDNPVFPGYFVWWGIDASRWMNDTADGASGAEIKGKIRENHLKRCYAPGYLALSPGSPYGNNAFSMTLKDILDDYKSSRNDQQEKKVCLKGGGTLRYRNEICYVVMVCMEDDNISDTFDINNQQPVVFDPNDLVDEHGIIEDHSIIPKFKPHSIVKAERASYYDWENLAFCFYFPSEDQRLTCTNVEVEVIDHDPPCTAHIPVVREGKREYLCPNKLGRAKVLFY